jgi:hypothetical protein
MGGTEDFICRAFFKIRIHESAGDAFQRLFSHVMGYADPRFQSIKPFGNQGDGGNDGWIPEVGHYFQVYGPEATTSSSATAETALKKAIRDFDTLLKNWANVCRYYFAMNDRFLGIPKPIAIALQQLQIDKKLELARGFEVKDLMAEFMRLPMDQRQDIIGGIPSGDLTAMDPRHVSELLRWLTDNVSPRLTFLKGTAPDFDKKVDFNGLTEPVVSMLRANSWSSLVDEFLGSRDPGLLQAIALEVRDYYQQSKEAFPDDIIDAANLRYFWLADRLIPPSIKHPHSLGAYRQAAELVIAKFFETCDAYDDPNGTPTA